MTNSASLPSYAPRHADALVKQSRSRVVRRWTHTIVEVVPDVDEQIALVTVLIIESFARRTPRRILEWSLRFLIPVRQVTCRISVGPLQLRAAPWARRAAVAAARCHLQRCPEPVTRDRGLARCWHGAATRQHGERASYQDAVAFCRPIARRLVGEARQASTVPPANITGRGIN